MGRGAASFVAAMVILIAGGSYSLVLRHPAAMRSGTARLESIPMARSGWVGRDIDIGPAVEKLLDIDRYIYREYVNESGVSIWLFVGYFTSQKFGSGIHSPRNCLPGSGWEIVNRSCESIPGDSSLTANRMDIMRGDSRQVMYYWFVTRAGQLNNEYSLKGDLVKSALMGRPTDAAFIRINTPSGDYPSKEAENRVGEFVRIFKKDLDSALPF